MVKRLSTMWETWVWALGWEDTLEKWKATHSIILAWRIVHVVERVDTSEWFSLSEIQNEVGSRHFPVSGGIGCKPLKTHRGASGITELRVYGHEHTLGNGDWLCLWESSREVVLKLCLCATGYVSEFFVLFHFLSKAWFVSTRMLDEKDAVNFNCRHSRSQCPSPAWYKLWLDLTVVNWWAQ